MLYDFILTKIMVHHIGHPNIIIRISTLVEMAILGVFDAFYAKTPQNGG